MLFLNYRAFVYEAIALLQGGKGLGTEGWDKQKADEKIRGISNQVNNGVGIVGDRNIGINIGTAGDITLGNLSSGSDQRRNPDD